MKSTFRQICCMLLVASLLLQAIPMAMAQTWGGPIAGVRNELIAARDILLQDNGGKKSQNAVAPLDRARLLAGNRDFARAFNGPVSDFRSGIEKARIKVLWNDRNEALLIVNHLLGMLNMKPVPQTPCGNGPGAGAIFGAALIAGLGGLILLLFTGQVSHR